MTKQLELKPETTLLIEARDLIEQGWTQNVAWRRKWYAPWSKGYCLMGALNTADARRGAGPSAAFWGAMKVLLDVLPLGYDGQPAHFNDTKGRTKAEVLAVLDKAIEQSMM